MDKVTFLFGGWEPVARILIVGTLAYTALVLLLRATAKRTLAQMNAFDFIITVALGASFGRILTARSVALVEAITAFALLIFLQFAVSALQVRSRSFSRLVTAAPTLLFFRGEFVRKAMQQQRVTEDSLRSVVREHGLGSFDEVEAIVLEPNGHFALVKKKSAGDGSALLNVPKSQTGG